MHYIQGNPWNDFFSSETMKARRKENNILKVLKERNCQPRILSPGKIFFKDEGELKTFSDEGILNFFLSGIHVPRELGKEIP